MRWLWFAVFAFAPGCFPTSNVCGTTPEPLTRDGGAWACLRSEECPRSAGTIVCIDNGRLPETDCVACDEGQCVLHRVEPCR